NIMDPIWNSPIVNSYSFTPINRKVDNINCYMLNTNNNLYILLEFISLSDDVEIYEKEFDFESLDVQVEDYLLLKLILTDFRQSWDVNGNIRLQSHKEYSELLANSLWQDNQHYSISSSGHVVINEVGYDGIDHANYTYETPGNDTNFSNLIITEVLYDPSGNGDTEEWIGIYNPTESTIDLTSWSLANNGVFNISLTGNINSGDYFVLARNTVNFQILYPSADPPDQENSTIDMTNNGDYLSLNYAGIEIDYLAWKNGNTSWKSLSARSTTIRRFSLTDTNSVNDWEDSSTTGDPGSGLFAHAYNTTLYSERDEYFVIYNPTASPVSLNNWIFSDGEGVVQFNSTINVAANIGIIIAKDADSFYQRFNIDANYEWNSTWGNDQVNNATVADLILVSGEVNLTNSGDFLYLDNEVTDSDSSSFDIVVWESLGQDFSPLPEGSFTGTLPSTCSEGQAIRRVNIGVDGSEITENNEDLSTTFGVVTANSSNPPPVIDEFIPRWLSLLFLATSVFIVRWKKLTTTH
ncbi:MAG: lamin tail domain-containing protein, partial [Candidatus Hodarchaeales archaeon]